jgi:hypothetical protein
VPPRLKGGACVDALSSKQTSGRESAQRGVRSGGVQAPQRANQFAASLKLALPTLPTHGLGARNAALRRAVRPLGPPTVPEEEQLARSSLRQAQFLAGRLLESAPSAVRPHDGHLRRPASLVHNLEAEGVLSAARHSAGRCRVWDAGSHRGWTP